MSERPAAQAISLGDHTFAVMKKVGIDINPVTFELFYDMVSGNNPELKRRFNALGAAMTRADLDKLCREFLPHHFADPILDKSYDSIREELSHFQEDLAESQTSLSEFAGKLTSSSRALTKFKSSDIQPIVAEIARVNQAANAQREKAGEIIERVGKRLATITTLRENLDDASKVKFTDPVTGLGNRRAFLKDLAELYKTDRLPQPFTLVSTTFLNFQVFNQPELNKMREQILASLARGASERLGDLGAGYWLDRSEGAFILETTDEREITRFSTALHGILAREMQLLRASAKNLPLIGMVFGCADCYSADNAATVIRNAEQALAEARTGGDGRVVIFGAKDSAAKGRDYQLYGRGEAG